MRDNSVADGSVVALIVARIPEDAKMRGLELEQGPRKESMWHPFRTTHPRWHLLAVASLLITGALVIYMATGTALIAPLPCLNNTSANSSASTNSTGTPPNYTSAPLDPTNSTGTPPNYTSTPLDTNSTSETPPNYSSAPLDTNSTSETPPNYSSAPLDTNSTSETPQNSSALDFTNSTSETAQNSSTLELTNSTSETPQNSSALDSILATPEPEESANVSRVYYQSMSETWHSMSDRNLLRKAVMTVGRDGPGEVAKKKLAFLFMARGALPFGPLWERYLRGHAGLYSIYIHAHPDYVPTWAPSSPFFGRFVPSKVVRWGTLSVYEAERRLLGNALLEPTNEWFLLLSESCIPIFNFPETYNYFNNSPGMSFIESYVDSRRQGQGRLYRGRYSAMAPEITAANFRKGSQWFQITRDLALMAANDSKEYAKFEKYFCQIHAVCYIDEHFLPTLAWIVRPHAIAYRTLTYYSFRGKSPHPIKYDKGNTDVNLIQWFRSGHNCTYNGHMTSKCHLFVRKFDPNALDILLNLAGPVMGIP